MDWQTEFRQQFPITQDHLYANIAYTSPLSPSVTQAIAAFMDDITYARRDKPQWLADAQDIRARLAALLGGAASRIAFTKNTTEGLNIVAQSIAWQSGDNVVINDQEHPTNALPWLNLRRRGVEVRVATAKAHRFSIDDLWAQVDARTRVIAVSWVQYSTGFRTDIQALGKRCREHGIWLVVDGIQAAGLLQVKLDDWHIDAFSAGAHKGLLGPLGVGFLHLSESLLSALEPACIGPSGATTLDKSSGHFDVSVTDRLDARRLETGNLNFPGLAGFARAIEMIEKAGPARIEPWVLGLARQLSDGLRAQGYHVASPAAHDGERSTTTSVQVAQPDDFLEYLRRSKVVVTKVEYGYIRISMAAYNTPEDVRRILSITDAYAKTEAGAITAR